MYTAKKLSFIFLCLALAFTGTGCEKLTRYIEANAASALGAAGEEGAAQNDADDLESSAVHAEADVTYTNSYLDFSFTIPKGWWLYNINENNFSTDPSQTESPEILDISYGEDAGMDYSYIGLVSFANLRDSRRDNHIGLDISAETLDGVNSLEEYMDYLEGYMLEPDEYTYELRDSGHVTINGLRYETRTFEVIREESNFITVTYTRPAANNYYLTIEATYWPDNKNAKTLIANSLSKAMP